MFATALSAAEAVVELGLVARPSMVELTDNASINIVEDARSMGLDRTAGALLVIQSDTPGAACAAEIAIAEAACTKHGATECFSTDDVDKGEMFVEAQRAFFPALEGRGALMLEDVGAPVPQLPALLAGIQAISAARQVAIPVAAHAGDGNTYPTSSSTRPTKRRRNAPRSRSPRSWNWPSRSAARSPANTASAASRSRCFPPSSAPGSPS
jgi:glycolate dehydrogenase FAD-linked subunit